jgi:multidrug efflux pump subunit AcrA (membrane-fusion protein)
MKRFFAGRRFKVIASMALIFVITTLYVIKSNKPEERITTTVEHGSVRQLVSVTGIAEAKQKADLAFPVLGLTTAVLVEIGDTVEKGVILAILNTSMLEADRQEALAGLASAVAERGALIQGPTNTARSVTSETVQLKKDILATTRLTEESRVVNAKRALLSSGLTAFTNNSSEDAPAPTVSGSYSCEKEGTYILEMYHSEAESGYSYRLSGIETGTFSAATNQPAELGSCGLRIQFETGASYGNSTWLIEVPNRQSATYTIHKNTFELTELQAASAIALAEQEVRLAEANETLDNDIPRPEVLAQADAKVAQAQARVDSVEAEIENRVMRAPFSGTITELNIKQGEAAGTEPIMTLMTGNEFEVTARIPEIDIGKLSIGQKVEMVFDAKSDETLIGTVSFLSLKAIEIDGVAYFEAYIAPEHRPDWFRSGLNADIDIIIAEKQNNLRLPKRFVFDTGNGFAVLKKDGDSYPTTTVDVALDGNDGFVAISGLNEGDIIAAP